METMSWVLFSSFEAHVSQSDKQQLRYCSITFRPPEQPDESAHHCTSDMMSHAAEHREKRLCSICDNWTEKRKLEQS